MRPSTVESFETLQLATLLIGLVSAALFPPPALAASPGLVLAVGAGIMLVLGGLTLLVSRRRSKGAQRILVVLCALGLPGVVKLAAKGALVGQDWIVICSTVLQLAALACLFTPSAKAWMTEGSA